MGSGNMRKRVRCDNFLWRALQSRVHQVVKEELDRASPSFFQVTLKSGLGSVDDLSFTDNSSGERRRRFRIGARVSHGDRYNGPRIKEAVTEAFIVKDHLGEANANTLTTAAQKTRNPPSLGDHVWRLEGIGRNGDFHNKLKDKGIKTVQDFLKLLVVDQILLRSILGVGMSDPIWMGTIKHARTCKVGEKQYIYANSDGTIILNAICQVMVIFLDKVMFTIPQLNPQQQIILVALAREASQKWHKVKEADTALLTKISTALLRNRAKLQGIPEIQVADLDESGNPRKNQ